jgi:hypothetical protein
LLGLAQLARMIAETETTPSVLGDRIDIAELADRYVTYAERRGRKRSTIANVKTGALPEGQGRLAGERRPVPRQAA